MRTATARTRRVVEKSPYELAEIAARREGLDLDEWLEQVVAEEAADRGLAPADLEPEERLDAIAKRLLQDRAEEDPRETQTQTLSGERDDGLETRIESAIEKLSARAETTDARTAQAFESLTHWLERSEADRKRERESLSALNERLAKFESQSAAARRRDDVLADSGRRSAPETSDAVARIARRQAELDARQAAAQAEERRKTLAEKAERERETTRPVVRETLRREAPREREPVRASARAPQDDVEALGARLDRMRAKQGRRRLSAVDTDELRAGLAAMSRSVADIAPRDGGRGLRGAVGDLGARLSRARNAGADGRLVAPVEAMLRQVLDTLKTHDPRAVADTLERDLKEIGAKVESLARASVTPDILDAIRQQSREVNQMLAAAARNSVPAARLENQIKDLAERVDQLAHDPSPHAEVAEVMQTLAEAQAQIEQSTPTSTLRAIERRIEDLAARIDDAVRRPAAMDPKPIQDLAQRIDGMRASIDRRASAATNSDALEATLRDINAKLDRVAGGDVSSQAMIASYPEMTTRLEDAHRRPAPATPDPRPAPTLAQRIEAVRTQGDRTPVERSPVERPSDVAPRIARLEAAIGDLSQRLQRPAPEPRPASDMAQRVDAAGAAPERASDIAPRLARLEAAIGDLAQRLDRPAPAAPDPRPVQELAQRIDNVRASIERQSDVAPRVARLEAAIGGLSEKLERPAPAPAPFDPRPVQDLAQRIDGVRASIERQADVAPRVARLEAAIGGLSEKLERPAPTPAPFDSRPLEDLSRRIEGMRTSLERQGTVAPRVARIEATLDGISEKLERPAPSTEVNGLNATLRELTERIEEAFRRPPSVASLDPRPIEDLAKRIEGVRATVERQGNVAPQVARLEATLGGIAEKLERPAPRIDAAALNAAIDELPARIEQAMRQHAPTVVVDPAPMNDLARRIEGMRAIVERQTNWGPQFARLEGALADLAGKLEHASPGFDASALVGPLEQLAVQIEEAFRRQPAGGLDPAPLEDLARRVDAVRVSVERQTNWGPQFARLEDALGDLTAKLERAPQGLEHSALIAPLEQLAAQIDEAFRRQPAGGIEPAALDDLARSVESVRASVERQTNWGPQFARLEEALGDLAERFERGAASVDASALVAPLEHLATQVEEAFRRPQTSTLDPAPLEDLARQVESVRASVERQSNFEPQFARLEQALGDLAQKFERGAASVDASALVGPLEQLAAQVADAFHRPAVARIDHAPLDDLARRVESVRASVASQANWEPQFARLESALADLAGKIEHPAAGLGAFVDMTGVEAALREVGSKLERPGFSTDDMGALVGAIEDLSARVDRGAAPIDTAPFERLLRDLGDRLAAGAAPPAVDFGAIEHRLDAIAAKVDAVGGPSPDMLQLELAMREMSEKIDSAQPPDLRPIETGLRALRDRIEEKGDSAIDLSLVERAVDIIAKRLDQKIGAIDADVLAHQIAEIHGRLDALGVAKSSSAGLERALADMMDELETMRQQFDAAASYRRADGSAGVQAEQANFDRRMDARFASVQTTLDRLGERLHRIEGELTSEPDARVAVRPQAETPSFASPSQPETTGQTRMRDIPDRLPVRAPERPQPELLRAAPIAERREPAPDPAPSAAPKHAAINAHIQAARRAANAALEESARREDAGPSRPRDPKSGVGSILQTAQSAVAQYRRPLLLGGAGLLAALTTLAVVSEFRGGKHAPLQKSEIATPEETPVAELPAPTTPDAAAAALDPAPIGAIPSGPKVIEATLPLAGQAAPSDLVAGLPSGVPSALRDSAVKGDIGSQIEIALRFVEGRGVPRDLKLAARWLELAANKGAPFAQYRLGALYEKGAGVTHDPAIARGWYTKAAGAGNARAMHNLAVLDAQDGGAGKPDYAQAAEWFKRAATLGVRDSQFNLGVLYGRGLGVPVDLAQSWMWFSLAAQQGDGDAAHKRDEVANRMDGKALATATKALGEFKPQKPAPEANDAPPAAGAVDAKSAPAPGTKS